MLKTQANKCAICRDYMPPKDTHVDHDHGSGKVRELLCGRCNRTLGLVADSPRLLRLMADYIERHRLALPEAAD